MAYGAIKKIRDDEGGQTRSGELLDCDTQKVYRFQNQSGLDETNKFDVVDYTELKGEATDLKPNLQVRLVNFDSASPDVQEAVRGLLVKLAKDKNMTDVIVRKI